MERWVNDNKIVERVENGYIPVLPFESKEVGQGVFAILMTIPKVDYEVRQEVKQILNDLGSPDKDRHSFSASPGGINLQRYVKMKIKQLSKLDLFKLFFRKLFRI